MVINNPHKAKFTSGWFVNKKADDTINFGVVKNPLVKKGMIEVIPFSQETFVLNILNPMFHTTQIKHNNKLYTTKEEALNKLKYDEKYR